jgi:hypothetical protein
MADGNTLHRKKQKLPLQRLLPHLSRMVINLAQQENRFCCQVSRHHVHQLYLRSGQCTAYDSYNVQKLLVFWMYNHMSKEERKLLCFSSDLWDKTEIIHWFSFYTPWYSQEDLVLWGSPIPQNSILICKITRTLHKLRHRNKCKRVWKLQISGMILCGVMWNSKL